MTQAIGFAWLQCRRQYSARFLVPVPDWICAFDLPRRVQVLRVSLRLGWRLPDCILIADEFHQGKWSVWK
jgi:hypothetical protein